MRMKKFLQGAVLPFVIFSSGILLLGCNQAMHEPQQSEQSAETDSQTDDAHSQSDSSQQDEVPTTTKSREDLEQGSMLSIVRDVADVQFKTGDYIEKLQHTQNELQQAIESKDTTHLQQSVKTLTQELQGFNTALISLDLKSQEIDDIRQKVITANKQVLNSSLLNGHLDISKVDFEKLEKQMNTIQSDMLKLAGMVMLSGSEDQLAEKSSDQS